MKILTFTLIVAVVGCHPTQSSPFDAPYVVSADPLDVGLGGNRLCIAVAPHERAGIWWWEPGQSGCGSRSTGPGVFHAWDAVVVPSSDGTIAAKFKISMIAEEPRAIALRLEGAQMRALSTGAVVPIQRRSDLDIVESRR